MNKLAPPVHFSNLYEQDGKSRGGGPSWGNWLLYGGLVFLFLIYSNTFTSAFQFDDFAVIVDNPQIHLKSFTLQSLEDSIFSQVEKGVVSRPVARLSLALNWYLSRKNVFSYHVVNLFIHLLATFFLFNTLILLYKTPVLQNIPKKIALSSSLFAAFLWAANPVQTQAVTYIVQRMASMAGLFYIMGIFFYLHAKFAQTKPLKISSFIGMLICFVLALGSKENVATFPAALLLIEIIFFQDKLSWRKYGSVIITVALLMCLFCLLFAFFFLNRDYSIPIFHGYQVRYFNLQERLLTEARIVIYYISLLLYPLPERLSIAHDVVLSESLFNPLSTFLSIAAIAGLLLIAVRRMKQWPILSFAILFFFLNQLIESTIIPLELIQEHRNYLPSLFFFWPAASGFFALQQTIFRKSSWGKIFLSAMACVLVILFGWSTAMRNSTWKTKSSLWHDAYYKAPARCRPAFNLAELAEQRGRITTAIERYNDTLSLVSPNPAFYHSLALMKISQLYMLQGKSDKAILNYRRFIHEIPGSPFPKYQLAKLLYRMNRLKEAASILKDLIASNQAGPETHGLLGQIYLVTGHGDEALHELATSLQMDKQSLSVMESFVLCLVSKHKYDDAKQLLYQLDRRAPDPLPPLLWSVIYSAQGRSVLAAAVVARIFDDFSLVSIEKQIKRMIRSGINPAFMQYIKTKVDNNSSRNLFTGNDPNYEEKK